MKKRWYVAGSLLLAMCMNTAVLANIPTYLTQEEYSNVLRDNYYEDRGIVVENRPELGYLVYKNAKGQEITANYYSSEVVVEKQPYYESEDKIGYLDELFPNFSYDPRDTDVANIKAGDCIYIRKTSDNVITYISAYNDYVMRYGKIISFNYNTGDVLSVQLQDEKGNVYYYEIGAITPITKGGKLLSPNAIKVGDWARFLVCEKILGEGIIDEEVLEIVLDNNTRVISNVYRGQITSVDTYKKLLNIKNAQTLGKSAWSTYKNLVRLGIDTNTATAYRLGQRISFDYITRYLSNANGYVYIAAESYKGSENAVKLNFQGNYQNTLPASQVISATATSVKLLSGENIVINEDSIVVRDNRLVGAGQIMVGDTLQAVLTDNNQLAVGRVSSTQTQKGTLQVYRGRVKKVNTAESFQVETFSLLEDHIWYYHPTPQTFTIDASTKFYNVDGLVTGGVNSFVAHGSETSVGDVYTIVAVGDQAYAIVDMPYVTEATKGEIYAVTDDNIQIKDAYYYNTDKNNWNEYSKKNIGATITIGANTIIIKDGKVIPSSKLEIGDTVSTMVSANLKTANGTVTGYIIYVEN
ncbi:MAG: hypothetical protein E7231_08520 [Cellulosilyticum sp.]|nr:hypothetical protein [Cellulosilyticum sp.]